MVLKTKHWLALSLVPQVLLVKVLGSNPEWVETYYSEGIYPYISRFLRFLFGWVPFSVGDLFYTLLTFAAIRYLYLHGRTIWQRPKRFLVDLGSVLAVAYFIFHLFWGMNYYRLPLEEKLGIGREYSIAELERFTNSLVERSNHYQLLLTVPRRYKSPIQDRKYSMKYYPGLIALLLIIPVLPTKDPALKSQFTVWP